MGAEAEDLRGAARPRRTPRLPCLSEKKDPSWTLMRRRVPRPRQRSSRRSTFRITTASGTRTSPSSDRCAAPQVLGCRRTAEVLHRLQEEPRPTIPGPPHRTRRARPALLHWAARPPTAPRADRTRTGAAQDRRCSGTSLRVPGESVNSESGARPRRRLLPQRRQRRRNAIGSRLSRRPRRLGRSASARRLSSAVSRPSSAVKLRALRMAAARARRLQRRPRLRR